MAGFIWVKFGEAAESTPRCLSASCPSCVFLDEARRMAVREMSAYASRRESSLRYALEELDHRIEGLETDESAADALATAKASKATREAQLAALADAQGAFAGLGKKSTEWNAVDLVEEGSTAGLGLCAGDGSARAREKVTPRKTYVLARCPEDGGGAMVPLLFTLPEDPLDLRD